VNDACATFGPTSVVRIACEVASTPVGERRATAAGRALRTFASGRTTPMTPVDARKTSSGAAEQLGGALAARASRRVEPFLAGDRVRAAGVDDDGAHAAAGLRGARSSQIVTGAA
jgi:hypothetical protein